MDEQLNQEYEGFVCDSDQKAEWCIRKIKEAEEDTRRWELHYKKQLDKIRETNNSTVMFMTAQLQKYLAAQVAAGLAHITKTTEKYSLPSGTLETKHGTLEYLKDDKKLVEWLKSADMMDLIKTEVRQSPIWAELKKLTTVVEDGHVVLTDTGEIIDGLEAHMKDDTFSIK